MIVVDSRSELALLVARLKDGFEAYRTDTFLVFEYLIPLNLIYPVCLDESLVSNLVGHAVPVPNRGGSPDMKSWKTADQSHVHDI